jgi:hypothetical protein
VEAQGALRRRLAAGPLDAARPAQHGVAHAGVVARPSRGAALPRLDGGLRVVPGDQRTAVLVAEVHPAGVLQEDVEVGPRLARGLDGLRRHVHGAAGVGEGARLLAPRRRGQHHVRRPRRLGEEQGPAPPGTAGPARGPTGCGRVPAARRPGWCR